MAISKRRNKILGIAFILALSRHAVASQQYEENYGHKSYSGGSHRGSGLITKCNAPGTGGYFISKDKYSYTGAATACIALGGFLADLSNQNFLLASDLVLTCAGPNQRAWIGSWDYNENGNPVKNSQGCLSVFVGSIGPGGGIENICPGDRPVLCQLHQLTVSHNSLYSQSFPEYNYQTAVVSEVPVHNARPRGNNVPYPGNQPVYPPAVNHHKQGNQGGYPGGPGYGNGGYPYGGKKGHKGGSNGDKTVTVLTTRTVNGLVTTLTLSGIETTITVANAASIITLDAIVSTIVLEGVPSTITELIDGIPVTVTVDGIPSTSTVTMVGTSTITDLEVTITETDVELLTATEFVTATSTYIDVRLITDTQLTTATVTDIITDVELFTTTQTATQTNFVTITQPTTIYQAVDPLTNAKPIVTYSGDFKFPFSIPGFDGAGTYTLGIGSVITVNIDGSYGFTFGGPPTTSDGRITTFSFPFTIPNFAGPGSYILSPGNVVSVSPDGSYSFLMGGPPSNINDGGAVKTGDAATTGSAFSLPFNIPGFTGPGTYTLSPENVVSVSPDGSYSFLMGGPPSNINDGGAVKTGDAATTSSVFSLPFNIPGFTGPGTYTLSPGNVVSVNPDGSYSFLAGGPPSNINDGGAVKTGDAATTGSAFSLPFNIPGFTGPGTYTLSPGNVVSVNPDGSYSFLMGGPPSNINDGGAVKTGDAATTGSAFSLPFNIPGFTGPGTYTLSPGNVVSVSPNGSYSFLMGGPLGSLTITSQLSFTFPAISLPTLNLGGGFSIGGYSRPGIYTVSPGNVVSVDTNGIFSFISGGNGNVGSISLPSVLLPSVTLYGGFVLPDFVGAGTYTISPGNVVSIGANGSISWVQGGPQTSTSEHNDGTTLPSISLPTFTWPSITLPTLNLPTLNLGGGFNIGSFSGPGTYTVSPGNVVSVDANGAFSFLFGGNGNAAGSVSLPKLNLPTVTLSGGFEVPSYSGIGIYTFSPGNVFSIGPSGGITWLQGGPQTASGGGFTFPTISLPTFTWPSITLPTLNLPTLHLGGGFNIGGYSIVGFSGPGTYTISPGNVVSVDADGAFSFLSGGFGNVAGSVSLPEVSLPTLTLAGGITLPNYSGSGIYTYSPGNVVSIGFFGDVKWIQGGPSTAAGGGFTFPKFGWPSSTSTPAPVGITFPSITLPMLNLPTINLGNGLSIGAYTGAGTYTIGSGVSLSVGANGAYIYLGNSGPNGSIGGSLTVPALVLPTITLAGGFPVPNFSGPGIYTIYPGNVVSIGVSGGVTWIQGGPQSVIGGGFTIPGFTIPTVTAPAQTGSPGSTVIGGVTFSFPFNIPGFFGPGIYILSPGNVVQVNHDGTYKFISGGPPVTSTSITISPTQHVVYPITFPSITLPTVTFPNVNLPGAVSISGFTGAGIYTVGSSSVVSVNSQGSYTYITGNGFFNINNGNLYLPQFSFPTLSLDGGIQVPRFTGPGIYTITPGNQVSIDANGGVRWILGGPQFIVPQPITAPAVTYPTQISLPTITFPVLDLPTGGRIATYTGPGIYTLNANTIVSMGSSGSYSYTLGNGYFGLKTGSLRLPTITFPPISLPGNFNVGTFTGPGTYSVSPGNIIYIDSMGILQWIQGGPVTTTTTNQAGFIFPSLTLPSISLPTVTFGSIALPSYTGPGFYSPKSGNLISVGANGVVSIVSGAGLIAGANAGDVVSIPGITLSTVSFPTITLPGGYVIKDYTGAGDYSIAPGTVIEVGLGGSVSFLAGAPIGTATENLNGAGFIFPTFSFPKIVLPTITFPAFSFPNLFGGGATATTTASASLGLTTMIGPVTYSFPFNIPGFYGPGIYILSIGNVLQVNADGSYRFISGSAPVITKSTTKLIRAALPSRDVSASESDSNTSQGFVLPGFSFSGFSRRAAPSASEDHPSTTNSVSVSSHEDTTNESSSGFLSHILALF